MRSAYPEAYVRFLAHYHGDRDFFECHELLEEYWKEHPSSPYRDEWVGLIQAAVGMYHYRRGNVAGAAKSFAGALRRGSPARLQGLGLDAERWLERLAETRRAALAGEPYRDVDMPVADVALLAEATAACEALGFAWGAPSRMEDPELLHRHARRDRTDVIEARRQAYEARLAGR